MKNESKKQKQKVHLLTLVEGAVMVALAMALELAVKALPIPHYPQGGTVSLSAIPLIYFALRRGGTAGIGAGICYSLLEMMLNFYIPPAGTPGSIILCVLLDYLIGFGVLGVSGYIYKPFRSAKGKLKLFGSALSAIIASALRFLSSFASGIILYGSYAPEGQPVWLYSLLYNGGYMLPNGMIAAVALILISAALDPVTLRPISSK